MDDVTFNEGFNLTIKNPEPMRHTILLIVFAFCFSQFSFAQTKSNGSKQSNKQTINTSVADSTELKAQANHNTARSNKTTIKEKDSIVSKSKAQDHNSSRSNKTASIRVNDSINSKTKANINTSRSNKKGQ